MEDGERSARVQGFCRGLRAAEPPGPYRRPARQSATNQLDPGERETAASGHKRGTKYLIKSNSACKHIDVSLQAKVKEKSAWTQ